MVNMVPARRISLTRVCSPVPVSAYHLVDEEVAMLPISCTILSTDHPLANTVFLVGRAIDVRRFPAYRHKDMLPCLR